MGVGERKKCVRILLGDDSGILGICVKILWGDLCECFVLTCIWCSSVFFGCCVLSSGWGLSSTGGIACLSHLCVF